MNVYIRLDANTKIGSGILCAALSLRRHEKNSNKVLFISRGHSSDLSALLKRRRYPLYSIPVFDGSAAWKSDAYETAAIIKRYPVILPVCLLLIITDSIIAGNR